MKPVFWNLFLVGVLLVSLSVGSVKLAEPLTMADLADYSPVIDVSGNTYAPEKSLAPFSWPMSSMTPAATTAVTTMPSWATTAISSTVPTTSPVPTTGVPSSSPIPTTSPVPTSSPVPKM